jgi:hypothetical protein
MFDEMCWLYPNLVKYRGLVYIKRKIYVHRKTARRGNIFLLTKVLTRYPPLGCIGIICIAILIIMHYLSIYLLFYILQRTKIIENIIMPICHMLCLRSGSGVRSIKIAIWILSKT